MSTHKMHRIVNSSESLAPGSAGLARRLPAPLSRPSFASVFSLVFTRTRFCPILNARRKVCVAGQGPYAPTVAIAGVGAAVVGLSPSQSIAYRPPLRPYSKTPHTHICACACAITHEFCVSWRSGVVLSLYLLDRKEIKEGLAPYAAPYGLVAACRGLGQPVEIIEKGGI